MNGVHDMGGMQCYGPVEPETNEPTFHADWEKRVLAINLAVGRAGGWNIDQGRSARESLPPVTYLSASYYQIWWQALVNMLIAKGLICESELASVQSDGSRADVPLAATWEDLRPGIEQGSGYDRPTSSKPLFAVGDLVRARVMNPQTHTRLPRYVRGKKGVIAAIRGAHVFPDKNAATVWEPIDREPEWLYTVVFDGVELWGDESSDEIQVSTDAWEPYLESVSLR
ncbi:MAG: nitrile hydratase subunit beta [Antricoccus sp.]